MIEHAKSIDITTDDNKTHRARLVGTDPKSDIALLKVDGDVEFPFVRLSDRTPRIGEWILAVGNPFGLGGTVTSGIVSARARDIKMGSYNDSCRSTRRSIRETRVARPSTSRAT